MDPAPVHRLSFTTDNGPSVKRFKGPPEVPAHYSDAVRKKLASTSRTGQACDRCREKDEMRYQPHYLPSLPPKEPALFDHRPSHRKASERGQSDRQENELHELRRCLASYQQKHGPLDDRDLIDDYSNADAYANHLQPQRHQPNLEPRDPTSPGQKNAGRLQIGPVNGTIVDLIGDEIDIGDFICPEMEDYEEDRYNKFNTSKTSVINTIFGKQSIDDPQLPEADEALKYVKHFLTFIWPYVPILHRSSFLELTKKYYADPNSVSNSERISIVLVLAIIAHQSAIRNPTIADEMMEKSNRWFHYALSNYRQLFLDRSLATMQAVTLIITHLRNLPKPGYSWVFSHEVLVKAIDLNYHRSPDRVKLPDAENDVLSKELRKRVFWTILGICVTIGTKQGKPAPWQFAHVDVPLPMAIRDTEISREGLKTPRSGKCDFWVALRLFKLLPLLTELYNGVICVRRPKNEYLRIVDTLDEKIRAWRKEWDEDMSVEDNGKDEGAPTADDMRVATWHVDIWATEFQLILHHPKLDTSGDTEVKKSNLETCHSCSKRLLQAFKTLSQKHRGADFTWHTTVAYALAFGVVLHIYDGWKRMASLELFEAMRIELREWLVVMGLADTVMKTNSFLMRNFKPRVQKLQSEYRWNLGLPLETNSPQTSHPQKPEPASQVKMEATPQQHLLPVPRAAEHSNHRSATDSAPYPPYYQYPHPPLFPESYQFDSHSTLAPSTQYSSFTPTANSHQVPYPQVALPTSLAPLLNHTSPVYASYPHFNNSVEVWPDYTDERSVWPRSIHSSIYQDLDQ